VIINDLAEAGMLIRRGVLGLVTLRVIDPQLLGTAWRACIDDRRVSNAFAWEL
jgi:hypothetical protein